MRAIHYLLVAILAISALLLIGCDKETVTQAGSGSVEMTVEWPSTTANAPGSLFLLSSDAPGCILSNVAPDGITTIEIVIGGPDMSAISATFDAGAENGDIPAIPAGPNRRARVIARDSSNITRYAGDSPFFTVDANNAVAVTVEMELVNHPPTCPTNPDPPGGATDVALQPTFSWDASEDIDGDPIAYDFYLGLTPDPPLWEGGADLSATSFTPFPLGSPESLQENTEYFWRVVAKDVPYGSSRADCQQTWHFTTVASGTYEIPASDDAYVDDSYPSQNYGAQQIICVADTTIPSTYIRQSLIRFDLSFIPQGSYVSSATLRLFKSGSTGSGSIYVAVNRVTGSWAEGAVTWNTKPAFDQSGGSSSGMTISMGDPASTIYDFEVTQIVRYCIEGTESNHGFILRMLASNDDELSWHSKESFATQYHPLLIVNYSN